MKASLASFIWLFARTSRNLLTGALFQAMPLMTMVNAIARTPFLAPSRQALIVWLKARRTSIWIIY
ncbi:hypothetical protein EDC96DRAFT_613146, partial [Choanephora cucurbitarum]